VIVVRHLSQHELAGRVPPELLVALGQQLAQHLIGGPAHGGHGRDAQPLVDLGPARVVDPGHHPAHPERLPDHARRDHVGVIAAAHRRERIGALDAGLDQDIAVEADAGHLAALEAHGQLAERLRVLVDDRD